MVWMLWLLPAEAKQPWCWVPGKVPFVGRTTVEFRSLEQLIAEEAQRAAAEMREPSPIPANGAVTFRVERATLGLASGDNQLFVVESGGQQVVREEPDDDVPHTPSGMYGYWWNVFVVGIPADVSLPLVVHAVDRVSSHRCSWSIDEKGKVKRL